MPRLEHSWHGKIAVITGASSGIGAATALRLAREGLRVILVARRIERLSHLATRIRASGGQAEVIAADLTQEPVRKHLFDQVREIHGNADVLINNAGFGWYGYSADMLWSTALQMVQVNVAAVVHLTLLFLQDMRLRNTGHIVNMGSISGSLPSQGVALYGATKSFLDAFTTALYREMRGSHVHLSVVRAGPVTTEFFQTASNMPAGSPVPTERLGIRAEKVADRVWGLLQRPRRVIYVPWFLGITPWVELSFGWLIDRLGPLLLRRRSVQP